MSNLRINILFVLLSLVISASGQSTGKKSSKIEISNGMPYYMHTVEKNQTLYALSKLYEVEVSDITANNVLKDGQLKVGSTIRVPQLMTAQKQADRKVIEGREYILHTVIKGETLFSIGRAYNIKPSIIVVENPESSAVISAGQILKIPQAMMTPAVVKAQVHASKPLSQRGKHIVQQGESLYGISKQYNTTVGELLTLNPECNDGLRTGMEIAVPLAPKVRVFFYHQVEKGDTFYSISRLYGVSTDQLQKDNALMLSGIKPGMFLRIERTPENISIAKEYSGFSFHEVEKGDTYYSICRQYDIEPKKLKKLNPGADEKSLAIGSYMMVPMSSYIFVEEDIVEATEEPTLVRNGVPFFSCDSLLVNKKRVLNIALMLPLYLNDNDTANRIREDAAEANKKQVAGANLHILPKSLPFLEFYEGVLLAIDTLKQQGYSINLSVYDTQRDTNTTKALLKKLDKSTNLIIGPVYSNTFKVASAFARINNIPIVSPLSSSLEDIAGNPQAMIINTPQQYRIETTALYFAQNKQSNFIMVHDGSVRDFEIMDMYKNVLLPSFSSNNVFSDVVFKELNFTEQGITGVQDALSVTGRNIVIIPSQNQGFVNNIITQIFQFQKRYDVQIAGLSQWEQYDNIELDYLFGLNYHFGTGNYIDYNSVAVRDFIKTYRTNFRTEPTKYSFQAYDIFNYYARLLVRYPFFTCECIEEFPYQGIQSNFNMIKLPGSNGIVNTDVRIVRYNPGFTTEVVDFDSQKAQKAFNEKQKATNSDSSQFEQLFKK